MRFVLEGSVQKSSGRVRITAQLIDAITGANLWAEQFDGVPRYHHRSRRSHRDDRRQTCYGAISWFEKAIELDPSYGKPYAKIAWAHLVDIWLGWSEDTSFSMAEALKYATAAIKHDDDEAWVIGPWQVMFGGYHDRAISAYQRALELNPNDADVLNDFGQCLSFAGRATEGVEVVHKAMRLNPHYPDYWVMQLGPIYFDARRYEDAISTLEKLQSKDTIGVQLSR